jgi:uncharacterized protein YbjQ (UPF0145 family)
VLDDSTAPAARHAALAVGAASWLDPDNWPKADNQIEPRAALTRHRIYAIARGDPMILTTTPGIDGKAIGTYLGIVTGEAIVGANIFRDLFANIRDIVGGRSAAYEQELARARTIALDELKNSAQQLGAHAVVGIDLDYEVLGTNNGMLMVSVSGTAVTLA